MLSQMLIFILKVVMCTSLGLLGVYNAERKKKRKMRIFDQLTIEQQQGILFTCISYAKGEIQEFNLPASTDVIALAVQYDTMYFLTPIDFSGQNIETIPAFVGGRPVKRP